MKTSSGHRTARMRVELLGGYLETDRELAPSDTDVEATCFRKYNQLANTTELVTPWRWLELAAEICEAGFYVRAEWRSLKLYRLALECRDNATQCER